MKPHWNRAYEQVSKVGIEQLKTNITSGAVGNWGEVIPPPPAPEIPVLASEEDQRKLAEQHEHNLINHTVAQFILPFALHLKFSQQYASDIHQAAFLAIQNSTDLPFEVESEQFVDAYTGTFARMTIHQGSVSHLTLSCKDL